jgi:L-gulonate 3-dehydrogenase
MRTVACIGVGNVGRAWAIVFARAGYQVTLYDADTALVTDRALPMIRGHLADLADAGLLENPGVVAARIQPVDTVENAVAHAIHVQESVKEDAAVKAELFALMDRCALPDAVLASSTSAIPGSEFMKELSGRRRCLIAHPVNPPDLIPLVEICASPWTDPQVMQSCLAFMEKIGQTPILVNREIPGFILNRLQFVLVTEALHLVGEGYCSVDDIDKVLTAGLARRWAFIGPFEVMHLNATAGYRGFMQGLGSMIRTLAKDAKLDYDWDAPLVDSIHGHLAQRTPLAALPNRQAWRDRQLMALSKHLDSMKMTDTPGSSHAHGPTPPTEGTAADAE